MGTVSVENVIYMIRIQMKVLFNKLAGLAAVLLVLSMVFISMKNLEQTASANVLEKIVGLAGVIFIAPLCYPEEKGNVPELLMSKRIRLVSTYVLRLIIGALFIMVITVVLIAVMRNGNCSFPLWRFFAGTVASSFFIGAFGFCVSALTYNTVAGIFVSAAYYILNMFAGDKMGIFYLFSMTMNSYNEKIFLLTVGILLSVTALVFGKNGAFRDYSGR